MIKKVQIGANGAIHGDGYVPVEDFAIEVALGRVPGWGQIKKFGRNPAIGNAEEFIGGMGGVLAYPAITGEQVYISSSSANDNATGSGAHAVWIQGTGSGGAEVQETIDLSGQTQVQSVNSYSTVYRMKAIRLTATNPIVAQNAGNIWCGTTGETGGVPAVKYCSIEATRGQSLFGGYRVPLGKKLIMTKHDFFSNSTKAISGALYIREFGSSIWHVKDTPDMQGFPANRDGKHPNVYSQLTYIELRATGESVAAPVSGMFEGYLVDWDYSI